MQINGYKFGSIVIDGETYTDDVIILPSGVEPGWWREEGHSLCMNDLEEVITSHPAVLVIGTGASGNMKVPDEVLDKLKEKNIEPVTARTGKAVDIFNEKAGEGRNVAGAFHLTC